MMQRSWLQKASLIDFVAARTGVAARAPASAAAPLRTLRR